MQVMEPWDDAEKWNPMMDDFYNGNFNTYGLPGTVVRLFISGIPPLLTEDGLRNLMSQVAKIRHVTLIAHKNIGFVSVHQNDALRLITYFNNYQLGDSYLTVKLSKTRRQTENEPREAACGTAGEEEQRKKTSSSCTRLVSELKMPALAYPSAAKYIQIGQELAVRVLSVASPSQFFVCRDSCDDDGQMTELHTNMQMHYSSLPARTNFRPNGSGLYAAPKRDSGKWCRVQALSFDTESVSVLYLDYGTHDQVSITKLQSLEGMSLSLPFRAICCSLSHLWRPPQWGKEATNCMCQLLNNAQQVRAKVCDIDGYSLSVELILSSGQTVNDMLVSRKHANYVDGFESSSIQAHSVAESHTGPELAESSEDTAVYYTTLKDLNFVPLSVDEQYDVFVLHARNASDVTVFKKNDLGELKTLMMELSRYQLSDSCAPQIGEVVAAQYAADGSWNRAEVLLLDDNSATVRFIDFGNTAKVNIKSMVQLQPRHVTFPVYSSNVMFKSSNVDSKLLTEHSNLKLKVIEIRGTHYVVDLVEGDMASHLTSNQASQHVYSLSDIKWHILDAGKTYRVWVTDSTDVENFHVQVQDTYQLIGEQLRAICSSKSGGYEPQQIGELIVLQLDDTWYRAAVREIGKKQDIKCQLIDFGETVTTRSQNISRFDCELLTHPVAAKCSFYDAAVSSAELWKDDYLKPLENACDVYDMTVVEVKNNLHFVELVDIISNADLKQQLMSKGLLVKARSTRSQSVASPATSDWSSSINTPGYSAGRNKQTDKLSCVVQSESVLESLSDTEVHRICLKREKIMIVHANNPGSFYIQSASDSVKQKLEGLHHSITNFCRQSSHQPDTVAIGQIVGVMHDDGIWYRAEVVDSESGGKFRVQFVDYGITKTADSTVLCPLSDSLAVSLPRQAIHCAIDRVVGSEPDGSWSPAAVNCFKNMCENCDFILKSIFKSDLGSTWLVDLLHKATGASAKDMLVAHKIAMPKTRSVSDVGETQVKDRTSPVLLSNTVKNAIIQADDIVTVTCAHSPSSFFIQQQQHKSNVEALQEELNSQYREYDMRYCPKQVGELVAVMYNNCWYRCEVLPSSDVGANVFFVDHGNTVENVNVKNIRALPLQFATALPKLAVHCAIGGTCGTCNDGIFSEASGRWFRDSYLQVTCTVTKVKYTDSSGVTLVNLRKLNSDKTVRQSLLAYGMALESTGAVPDSASKSNSNPVHVQAQVDLPSNTQQPCAEPTLTVSAQHTHFEDAVELRVNAVVSVVHVVSPVDFYVQPSDPAALQQNQSLSQKLEHYCSTSDHAGYSPQYVGEPVAAKFEGLWYRAEVVKLMSSDCFEVFFVDFGNNAVVNAGDLHSLAEEFVKWPKQAVHCGIDHICGTSTGQRFTEASAAWFKQKFMCGSNATLSSVHVVNGKHMVNMSLRGDSDGTMELLVAAELARYSDL